jgi:hypothetical protein
MCRAKPFKSDCPGAKVSNQPPPSFERTISLPQELKSSFGRKRLTTCVATCGFDHLIVTISDRGTHLVPSKRCGLSDLISR